MEFAQLLILSFQYMRFISGRDRSTYNATLKCILCLAIRKKMISVESAYNFITCNICFARGQITHWGQETHICVGNLTIIDSDNGLSPGRRQAIIETNVGILLIGTLGTNFSEICIEMYIFSFKKMHLKVSFGKWRPFCLGLNVMKVRPHKDKIFIQAIHIWESVTREEGIIP